MKVWITKYVLSGGIAEVEVVQSPDFPEIVTRSDNSLANFHGEGREWHRTATGANAHAEVMRMLKIKRLKKQIAKLEAMRFEP